MAPHCPHQSEQGDLDLVLFHLALHHAVELHAGEVHFPCLSVGWAFSWIDHIRQMSKDYKGLAETGEAFIFVAMPRLMAND